ncbi:MAG: hypothetical protein ABIZ07_09380 [Dermatophilaceae bacterium]
MRRGTAVAGSREHASEHPIARAIAEHANRNGSPAQPASDFVNHGGQGVSGAVAGHAVLAGRLTWLTTQWALSAPEHLQEIVETAERRGQAPVWSPGTV